MGCRRTGSSACEGWIELDSGVGGSFLLVGVWRWTGCKSNLRPDDLELELALVCSSSSTTTKILVCGRRGTSCAPYERAASSKRRYSSCRLSNLALQCTNAHLAQHSAVARVLHSTADKWPPEVDAPRPIWRERTEQPTPGSRWHWHFVAARLTIGRRDGYVARLIEN